MNKCIYIWNERLQARKGYHRAATTHWRKLYAYDFHRRIILISPLRDLVQSISIFVQNAAVNFGGSTFEAKTAELNQAIDCDLDKAYANSSALVEAKSAEIEEMFEETPDSIYHPNPDPMNPYTTLHTITPADIWQRTKHGFLHARTSHNSGIKSKGRHYFVIADHALLVWNPVSSAARLLQSACTCALCVCVCWHGLVLIRFLVPAKNAQRRASHRMCCFVCG